MKKNLTTAFGIVCAVLISTVMVFADEPVSVEIVVITPDTLPSEESVYIAGDLDQLGDWSADGIRLVRDEVRRWRTEINTSAGQPFQFKITRGNWRSEALDSNEVEFPNFRYSPQTDTTIVIRVHNWRDKTERLPFLSEERLKNKGGRIEFFENWRFKSGDHPAWAAPEYDDKDWIRVRSPDLESALNDTAWNGIGWFRLPIVVDSSLWGKSLGFYLYHNGAADVYLNGEPLYTFGTASANAEQEIREMEREPKVIHFSDQANQVLAVRYSNHSDLPLANKGFFLILLDLNESIEARVATVRYFSILQSIFTVIPLTLALIHLLLFLYYRSAKENLFYALFMSAFALLSYANFQNVVEADVEMMQLNQQLLFISINLVVIFGMLTTYWHAYVNIPKHFFVIALIGLAFILISFFRSGRGLESFFYGFLILVGLELIRVIIFPFFRKKKNRDWPIVIGLVALVIAIAYQILLDTDVVQPIADYDVVYVYGILILGLTLSVNLARDFAGANRSLIIKEREAREREIQRRILESDNLRKTNELEEARNLQLSMLPTEIPNLSGLEIDVYMKTATEVGGDYYDFLQDKDGTLTVVIGDATGHGTKAGIMVALIKNIFISMGHTFYIPDFFSHCTKLIRKMRLGMMYMSLTLLRIRGNLVTLSAAGMPPVLIYRAGSGKIEQVVIKGLPLGGILSASYEQRNLKLDPGDTLLMMTDGFVELFNPQKESLDYPRVLEAFAEVAEESPETIIKKLVDTGIEWAKDEPQNDDITFIVIKFKG